MITVVEGISEKNITKKLSSGSIVEDSAGRKYLTYRKNSATIGLLAIDENFLIETQNVEFPIKLCSKFTSVSISNCEPNEGAK